MEVPLRRRLPLVLTLAVLLGATAQLPTKAHAKDLGGHLGVGLEQSLAGATGLAMRYFVSDSVGITTTLALDLTFADDDEGASRLATGFAGSFGVLAHVARSLHAHLGLGLRATVGWRSLASAQLVNPDATESALHLAIEVPLVLEFFLSDHFSVGASTGLLINFVPDAGATLPTRGAGGTTTPGAIAVGFGAGSMSTLAVLYYF